MSEWVKIRKIGTYEVWLYRDGSIEIYDTYGNMQLYLESEQVESLNEFLKETFEEIKEKGK